MRLLYASISLVIVLILFGCEEQQATTEALIPEQAQIKYSIEIESNIEDALLEGLPEGINITDVNKVLLKNINKKLVATNMKNNSSNIIEASYDIVYFGHRFVGPPSARFIIKYNLELLDKTTGTKMYSKNDEARDTDLVILIDEISDQIIKHICVKTGGCHLKEK